MLAKKKDPEILWLKKYGFVKQQQVLILKVTFISADYPGVYY